MRGVLIKILEVSGKYSDFTIITSDNPRDEEPLDIMKDIESGIKKAGINENDGKYVMIENRLEAIKYAVKNSQKGDVIVLAGKGHEDYQEIKGLKYHVLVAMKGYVSMIHAKSAVKKP